MLVHDGPLSETSTSHEFTGQSKCSGQAILRFSSVKSSLENSTNALGCTGRYVCLLSGSAVSLCTTISLRAVPLPPLRGRVTCCVLLSDIFF